MKKSKKGFTLIELIVVIAIIAILAAIAIPRFSALQGSSKVKAEAATAAQIVTAARIQETEKGVIVSGIGNATLLVEYMTVPATPAFKIAGGGAAPYNVSWTSTAIGFVKAQVYTENTAFVAAIT